jgi:hypothetical protein
MDEHEDTAIHDAHSYEVAVQPGGPFAYSAASSHPIIEMRDETNDINYTLWRPSETYLLYLIHNIAQAGTLGAFGESLRWRLWRRSQRDENTHDSIFDILRTELRRPFTLHIQTGAEKRVDDFIKYSTSFFFHVTYNIGTPFVPWRHVDEHAVTTHIIRVSHGGPTQMDPPRRCYQQDLVNHYQLAVASQSPSLQYLSYYHVAEHFFEQVFQNDLINRVKQRLTNPAFSHTRRVDIQKLIKEITRSAKLRDEDDKVVPNNERGALLLCLREYIDIAKIVAKLNEYDQRLVKHYRTTGVDFSGGEVVDLEGSDADSVLNALTHRVYTTRNSIVHSKEGEKGKYIPFKHDHELAQEVPLMRVIAERIIVESAQSMA